MSDLRLPSINRVQLAGRLTQDPEVRYTQDGRSVLNAKMATNRRYRDRSGAWQEETSYIAVVAWQALAERCAEYLRKGSAVFVEGRLKSHSWQAEDKTSRNVLEVYAQSIQCLDRRDSGEQAGNDLDVEAA